MSHDQDETLGFVPLENFDDFKKAVALLKRMEWIVHPYDNDGVDCEICSEQKDDGHAPDCPLAAFLKKWGK